MESTSANTLSETQTPTQALSKSFEFTGKAGEFFSIWVVNILLTILTLGIYSAWAKVRTNQYFYGNTKLDNHTFRYTADPKQILKGRIIAVILFAIYYFSGLLNPTAAIITFFLLMLLVPAFVVMSMSFQLRNSAYKNIRFSFEKNFKRSYLVFSIPVLVIGAYIAIATYMQPAIETLDTESLGKTAYLMIAFPLIIMLLFPWWEYLITKFKVTHAGFGTAEMNFSALTRDYYKIYLVAGLVFIVVIAIFIAIPAYNSYIDKAAELSSNVQSAIDIGDEDPLLNIFLPVSLVALYLWFFAYIQTKKTNLIYSNISIEDHSIRSELTVSYILYLYVTNTLAIIISLGLLIPWAKIRTARYRASKTSVDTTSDFDGFIGKQAEHQSAFGEEMGEVFDIDLGM